MKKSILFLALFFIALAGFSQSMTLYCFKKGECYMSKNYNFYKDKMGPGSVNFYIEYYKSGVIEFPYASFVYPLKLTLEESIDGTDVWKAKEGWYVRLLNEGDILTIFVCNTTEDRYYPGKYRGYYYVCQRTR